MTYFTHFQGLADSIPHCSCIYPSIGASLVWCWHLHSTYKQMSVPTESPPCKVTEQPCGKWIIPTGKCLFRTSNRGLFQACFLYLIHKITPERLTLVLNHTTISGVTFTNTDKLTSLAAASQKWTSKTTLVFSSLHIRFPFSLWTQQCSPVICLISESAATSQNSWKSGIVGLIPKVLF